ncbi:MAG: hypothetical protein D6742_01370 [Cyanobacteria bacterium J069]|nr:MAG: hypothetical protein D6742_01370 [Cyanobacteria bacterium J069]
MLTANLLILFVALPALVSSLAGEDLTSMYVAWSASDQMAIAQGTSPAGEQFHRGSGRCSTATCS